MLHRLFHLFALTSLAITQPLLGSLGEHPIFFVAHSATREQIIAFAAVVSLAPSAALGAMLLAVHAISDRAGKHVFHSAMAVLSAVFVMQVINALPWPDGVIPTVGRHTAAAIVVTCLILLYSASRSARSAVSLLAVFPVAVVALFLFNSRSVWDPQAVNAVTLESLLGVNSAADVPEHDHTGPAQNASERSVHALERLNDRFPPIYILVIDELPWASLLDEDGNIDAFRYPNFARLAGTSHIFANASTTSAYSLQAIPAILTGMHRTQGTPRFASYADTPDNLFTMLGDAYDITASESVTKLCPPSVCNCAPPVGIADLLATDDARQSRSVPTVSTAASADSDLQRDQIPDSDLWKDQIPDSDLWKDQIPVRMCQRRTNSLSQMLKSAFAILKKQTLHTLHGPEIRPFHFLGGIALEQDFARLESFFDHLASLSPITMNNNGHIIHFRTMVAAMEKNDHPHLSFLHTMVAHSPWHFRPDGSTYADLFGFVEKKTWIDDPYIIRFHQQRHLLQLGMTDVLLGEYLDRLHTIGDFDRAIVIVTADHGMSFAVGESSPRSISPNALAGTASVPLFYKEPSQKTRVIHHKPVLLTDIVPTIAAGLGIEPPWTLDGHDMFSDIRHTARRITNTEDNTVADVPEDLASMAKATAAEMHEVFGDGASGSLYALGGANGLIGSQTARLTIGQSSHCWIPEQPLGGHAAYGAVGYVYGRIESADDSAVAFALSVDGIVAGTARSYMDGSIHRVYAIGDSLFWKKSALPLPVVELHELVNGGLATIPHCQT